MVRPKGPFPEKEAAWPRRIVKGTNRDLTRFQRQTRGRFLSRPVSAVKRATGQAKARRSGVFKPGARVDLSKIEDRRGNRRVGRFTRPEQQIKSGTQEKQTVATPTKGMAMKARRGLSGQRKGRNAATTKTIAGRRANTTARNAMRTNSAVTTSKSAGPRLPIPVPQIELYRTVTDKIKSATGGRRAVGRKAPASRPADIARTPKTTGRARALANPGAAKRSATATARLSQTKPVRLTQPKRKTSRVLGPFGR